jgi:hypothetical protein
MIESLCEPLNRNPAGGSRQELQLIEVFTYTLGILLTGYQSDKDNPFRLINQVKRRMRHGKSDEKEWPQRQEVNTRANSYH